MFADIQAYNVGLFVHILAVVLAFGPTFAYGIFMSLAAKYPNAAPALLTGVRRCDRYFLYPGMAVLLIAGFYMIGKGDIDMSETYISVGLAAFVILLGLQLLVFRPQVNRSIELAERDLAAGGELSEEFQAIGTRLAQVGGIAGVIIIVTTFFMVVKP